MRVLHLLSWKLDNIIPILDDIKNSGFDAIQINPIQPLKDEFSNSWWMSYQPIDFTIGNRYGSKKDLINLCNKASEKEIIVIADVVCNHMAGRDDGSLLPHNKVANYLKNTPKYWKTKENIHNWDNRYEVTNYCMGLPGLDLNNLDLQYIIFEFLFKLINCGVKGFRFDAAKSIALPKEGCSFWNNMNELFTHEISVKYGEVLFSNPDLLNEYTNYISVLTENCNLNSDKIFNFIESHDSYLHFSYTKDLHPNEINRCYKELSNQSNNTLYYARPFDNDSWRSNIVKEANTNKVKNYVYKRH